MDSSPASAWSQEIRLQMRALIALLAQMKFLLLPVALCASLISCVTTPPAAPNDGARGIDAVEALTVNGVLMQSVGAVSTDPAKTDLPILRAVGAGEPKYEIMADGSYVASYRYGKKRYFKIIGTRRNLPSNGYPPHSTMRIMDQTIPSYATGNEDPEYTSRDTVFETPGGKSATFVFIHGGNRDTNSGTQIEKDVPKVTW